jgi:hypothetical protein
MLTYEELAPILHSQAYKFARQSGGKYTAHELIAECLLKKKCQNLPDIKMAHKRIRYDMIDYMRQKERRRRKFNITTIPLDIKLFDPGYIQTYPIDLKDEIRHILECLCDTDRKICRMLFDGYTQTDITEILKIPKGSMGYRMRAIRTLFREHFQ